ncbi:hypothetical protein V5J34_001763 [Endozoicomonas sp. NE35]
MVTVVLTNACFGKSALEKRFGKALIRMLVENSNRPLSAIGTVKTDHAFDYISIFGQRDAAGHAGSHWRCFAHYHEWAFCKLSGTGRQRLSECRLSVCDHGLPVARISGDDHSTGFISRHYIGLWSFICRK